MQGVILPVGHDLADAILPFCVKTSMDPAGVPHSILARVRRASVSLTSISLTFFDFCTRWAADACTSDSCPTSGEGVPL